MDNQAVAHKESPPQKEDLAKLPHADQIRFAIFCAEQVMHLVSEGDKPMCMRAVQTAYKFLEGKATREECEAAAYTAYTAAAYTAYTAAAVTAAAAAAYTAYTAYTAAYAAYAAAATATYATATYATATYATATYATATYATATYATADRSSIIEAQWQFYDQLLNADKYFEEIVLLTESINTLKRGDT